MQDGVVIITVEFRLEKSVSGCHSMTCAMRLRRVRSDLPADMRDPIISQDRSLAGAPILSFSRVVEP